MKLFPNTYEGLVWGLTHFDAVETDMRLTKDNQLVIYHDPNLQTGEKLEDLTHDELVSRGVPSFETFINLPEVVSLSREKEFYLEVKPNCQGKKRIDDKITPAFFKAFQTVIESSSINSKNINILSFVKSMLVPFIPNYSSVPIIVNVNECNPRFLLLKALPQLIFKSLTSSMKDAERFSWAGVFFPREYYMGWTSIFQPSYDKIVTMAYEKSLKLGSNLGTPDLEDEYKELVRFSDKLSQYPRHAKEGEGAIVAHRGTGTKGVEVPEDDVPQLSLD